MPRQLQSDPPLRWELGLLARQKHSPADPAATGPAGIEPAILRRTRAAKKWEGLWIFGPNKGLARFCSPALKPMSFGPITFRAVSSPEGHKRQR